MNIEDIINMSKAGVDTTVIKRQIELTHSKFKLDTDQIIQLKKEGVNEKIIELMIETGAVPEHFIWEYGYSPYNYLFNYNYYYQWNPRYFDYPWSYPYVYPHAGLPYYENPYTGVRRSKHPLIGRGRFYPYVPIYPPTWDFKSHEWTYH